MFKSSVFVSRQYYTILKCGEVNQHAQTEVKKLKIIHFQDTSHWNHTCGLAVPMEYGYQGWLEKNLSLSETKPILECRFRWYERGRTDWV